MHRWLGLLACLAVSGCAGMGLTASSEPAARAILVADVLELSGTRAAMPAFEGAVRRVVTALSGAETFRDRHVVTPVVESVITADRLYAALTAHLDERYDAERFARIRAMLREPLARRMTALEVASIAATPEAIAAWKQTHGASDDGRARLALARRIDAASGTTDGIMGVLMAAGRGIVRAFSDGVPPGARAPLERIRDEMAKLEPQTRTETVDALAYTYRDAPLAEVARYAELYESEIARWFGSVLRDAVAGAAERLSETAIRRLMDTRRAPRVDAPYPFRVTARVDIDRAAGVAHGEGDARRPARRRDRARPHDERELRAARPGPARLPGGRRARRGAAVRADRADADRARSPHRRLFTPARHVRRHLRRRRRTRRPPP